MLGKKKVAMIVAEFIGTLILLLTIWGVRGSGIGYSFFVALGAGLAVAALSFMFSENSGTQLNPALTLGLVAARKVKILPAAVYIVAQLLGAWAAYWLVKYFAGTHLQVVDTHYMGRLMVAEAAGAFIFAVGWTAAATQKFEGIRRAATLGGSFALAIIVASLASAGPSAGGIGYANPALALGSGSWGVWGVASSWSTWGIFVLGPVVGAVVGVYLYRYVLSPVAEKAKSKKK